MSSNLHLNRKIQVTSVSLGWLEGSKQVTKTGLNALRSKGVLQQKLDFIIPQLRRFRSS